MSDENFVNEDGSLYIGRIQKPWGWIETSSKAKVGDIVKYRFRKRSTSTETVSWEKPVHLELMEKLNGWKYEKQDNWTESAPWIRTMPCRAPSISSVTTSYFDSLKPPFNYVEASGLNTSCPLGRIPDRVVTHRLCQNRADDWSGHGVLLGYDLDEDDAHADYVTILTPDAKKISVRLDDIRPLNIKAKTKKRKRRSRR